MCSANVIKIEPIYLLVSLVRSWILHCKRQLRHHHLPLVHTWASSMARIRLGCSRSFPREFLSLNTRKDYWCYADGFYERSLRVEAGWNCISPNAPWLHIQTTGMKWSLKRSSSSPTKWYHWKLIWWWEIFEGIAIEHHFQIKDGRQEVLMVGLSHGHEIRNIKGGMALHYNEEKYRGKKQTLITSDVIWFIPALINPGCAPNRSIWPKCLSTGWTLSV